MQSIRIRVRGQYFNPSPIHDFPGSYADNPLTFASFTGQYVFINLKNKSINKDALPSWLVPVINSDVTLANKIQQKSGGFLEGVPFLSDVGNHFLRNPSNTSLAALIHVTVSDLTWVEAPHGCHRRWPTFAALILDLDPQHLTGKQRIRLWKRLKEELLVTTPHEMVLLEPSNHNFLSSIHHLLASGPGNLIGERKNKGLLVLWKVGCGSISAAQLDRLESLEHRTVTGQLSYNLSRALGWSEAQRGDDFAPAVERWFVFDGGLLQRRKRNLGAYFSDRDGSGLVGSGDGPYLPRPVTPIPPLESVSSVKVTSIMTSSSTESTYRSKYSQFTGVPVAPVPPSPLEILPNFIRHHTIPPETFYDPEDGTRLRIRLYWPVSPAFSGQKSATTLTSNMEEVTSDHNSWVTFDSNTRIIRFAPTLANVGRHSFTLCAFDRDGNKVCEPWYITVQKPKPISEQVVHDIPPGQIWPYQMKSEWLTKLGVSRYQDVTIRASGNAYFHWNSAGQVTVLSEAYKETTIYLNFNLTTSMEGVAIQLKMVLSVKPLPFHTLVTGPLFLMKFYCEYRYYMPDVQRMLEVLVRISEPHVLAGVKQRDILVYRIVKSRRFHIEDDIRGYNNGGDSTFEFEWVFVPFNYSGSCTTVEKLRGSTSQIKGMKFLFNKPFRLEDVRERSFGACRHIIPSTTTTVATTTTTTTKRTPPPDKLRNPSTAPSSSSSTSLATTTTPTTPKLIREKNRVISSFEVREGLAFRRPIYVEEVNENVQRIELLDTGDEYSRNSWVQVSSSSYALFGLPQRRHIRQAPYPFTLRVLFKKATLPPILIPFTIEVRPGPVLNHIITMTIHRSEGTLTLDILNSLKLRWNLAETLDQYFDLKCSDRCGCGIVIVNLMLENERQYTVKWAREPLLSPRTESPCVDLFNKSPSQNQKYQRAMTFRQGRDIKERFIDKYRVPRNAGGGSTCREGPKIKLLRERLMTERGNPENMEGVTWVPNNGFNDHLLRHQIGRVVHIGMEGLGPCARYLAEHNPRNGTKILPPERVSGDEDRVLVLGIALPAGILITTILIIALIVSFCIQRRRSRREPVNNCKPRGVPLKHPVPILEARGPIKGEMLSPQHDLLPSKPLILPNEKPPLTPPDCDYFGDPALLQQKYRGNDLDNPLDNDVLHQWERAVGTPTGISRAIGSTRMLSPAMNMHSPHSHSHFNASPGHWSPSPLTCSSPREDSLHSVVFNNDHRLHTQRPFSP